MFPSKRSDWFVTAGAELTSKSYCQRAIAACVKLSLLLVGLTGVLPGRCKVRRRARQRQPR